MLEVLVSVSILSFGIVYIFHTFFTSASILRHLDNRVAAGFIMEEKIWNAKKMFYRSESVYNSTDHQMVGENPEFDVVVKLKRKSGFAGLCEIESKAYWTEGRKNVTVGRDMFVRNQFFQQEGE